MTAEALPWVKEGKGKRCTKHDCWFSKTAVCKACATDKDRAPIKASKDPLPRPPAGCMSSVQLERWFTALAKRSLESAELVAKAYPLDAASVAGAIVVVDASDPLAHKIHVRDFHDEGAISKHRDNAIKAMRAAAELALRREDDHYVDAKHERIDARGKGKSH